MPAIPTDAEQRAYATMQARMVALLVRFNEPLYRRRYGAQTGYAPDEGPEELRDERELAVLFALRDWLFDDLLPRIVRRLSFETPRSRAIEAPPTRGRIDWERTLDASWAERPGEPPLLLHTRLRTRDFATPENILTVVTLLECAQDVRRLLASDRIVSGDRALRHPLNEIVARCERELSFPQFAAIRSQAAQIVADPDASLAHEALVEERGARGGGAYADLVAWRRERRGLRLLRRTAGEPDTRTVGADPRRDNMLYQLWIFYELAEVLAGQDALIAIEGNRALEFRWGAEQHRYRLSHNIAIAAPIGAWRYDAASWKVPGERPDFYLERRDPPPSQVPASGDPIWRSPGVVWDAKYYRERDAYGVPSLPVKRMIADLALSGETDGTLLFAFLRAAEQPRADEQPLPDASEASPARFSPPPIPYAPVVTLSPIPGRDQTIAPEVAVRVAALQPHQPSQAIAATLVALLDAAHRRLLARNAAPPACHGIFLDTLSVGATALTDRWGAALGEDGALDPRDLLICPKPHIGPWRVDLVSRAKHCCKDATLCQIVGLAGAQVPVRPPRDIDDLLGEIDRIISAGPPETMTDELALHIGERIQQLTRSYASFAKIDLAYYKQRVRDLNMDQTFDLLGPIEQESLALAEFLKEQLDRIKANDFSAPAIHLGSVLEIEVKKRVFDQLNLVGDNGKPLMKTLGTLGWLRNNPTHPSGNWAVVSAYVGARWNSYPDPDDPQRAISFEQFIERAVIRIGQLRNIAAHTSPLPRKEYTELQSLLFHGGKLGYGALNTLLRGWTEPE